MKAIETNRLLLRAWHIYDAEDLYEYAKNPNVGPDTGWRPHRSIEESYEIIGNFMNAKSVWAIEHKEDKKVIGSVGLHKDYKRPYPNIRNFGYALSEDYWGLGFATEAAKAMVNYAFTAKNIILLTSSHFTHNVRSKRVLEKCGMIYEGTLRMTYKLYDETLLDECCYSLSKEEYLKAK